MVKLGWIEADGVRPWIAMTARSADYSWIEISRVLPPVQ